MKKIKSKIPFPIWIIGIASGLLNITSSFIFSISGMFLNSRGITIDWISALEHTVEALAYLMKVFSGIVSDYFRRRKTIILIGFGLSMFSRPVLAIGATFFAASAAFIIMFLSRIMERIANGLQSTPRDALVADLSPEDIKGECFGLRQALTTSGSFIGSFLAILCLHLTSNNYEKLFWFATLPPIIAFLIIYHFVHDSEHHYLDSKEDKDSAQEKKGHSLAAVVAEPRHEITFAGMKRNMMRLGAKFWTLMIVVAVFMLARVSESILTLHALKNYGLRESWGPIVGVIYNTATALAAYPIGRLSDRFSRTAVLAGGCLCLVISDALLSFSPSIIYVYVGIAVWGIQIGVTQSTFLALIADFAPSDLRGTGFGIFNFFSAISIFMAGIYGGYISKHYSIQNMYALSGVIAFMAIIILYFVHKYVFSAPANNVTKECGK